jgi:diguanylate cyclase (GGDEF)-like protein
MDLHLFSSSRQIKKMPILPQEMSRTETREEIESALSDPIARIPSHFKDFYYQYQNNHQRHFLKQVNYIAQLAFLIYFFADWFVIPDMVLESGLARVISIFTVIIINYYLFKHLKDIRLLDLILPIGTIASAFIWFELLIHSNSNLVYTYQYASMILIVLGNLGIQIHFRQSIITSALISFAILQGVFRLNDLYDSVIFLLIYMPILMFSLYISWNNTLNGRRNFLRSLLDDWNFHKLNELAHTDELTQLNNRRQFVHIAERRVLDSINQSCSLLLFDVDNFKRINDQYGHDIGDLVLKHIAEISRQQMRSNDILARFGGEEFIALLTHTHLDHACQIAERLRQTIAAQTLVVNHEQNIQFTVSIGVAEFHPNQTNLAGLIKAADIALYCAKKNGRNQVVPARHSRTA